MNWKDFREAVEDAKLTVRRGDTAIRELSYMLPGRLRVIGDANVLRDIKRELRDFDMVTGRWKEDK